MVLFDYRIYLRTLASKSCRHLACRPIPASFARVRHSLVRLPAPANQSWRNVQAATCHFNIHLWHGITFSKGNYALANVMTMKMRCCVEKKFRKETFLILKFPILNMLELKKQLP